ncbi:MAG: hypothetical protein GF398_04195 [Chitinivibrionales bacterium]|nr:hypothetical protein [Chitinivibrionales bacterium]
MNIDPITIIAQIINFLVLVVVLYFVLFKRIAKAMDTREEKIRSRIERADKKEQTAQELKQNYEKRMAEADDVASKKDAEIKEQARKEAGQMLDEARKEVEHRKQEWMDTFAGEWRNATDRLMADAQETMLSLVTKLTRDLGTPEMQSGMINAFVKKFEQNGKSEELRNFLKSSQGPVNVVAARELDDKDKKQLTEAIGGFAGDRGDFSFGVDEDIKLGIELRNNGRKIGWGLTDYIESFREHVKEFTESKSSKST